MNRIWDRLDWSDPARPTLRWSGLPASEVVDRLGRGGGAGGLEAVDLVAALAAEALGPEGSAGPALVQVAPGRPGLAGAMGESAIAGWLPSASRPARLALAAGLLQVFDFWEASHQAAQEADDLGERATAAFWHGIAHRREPDPGNAAYWFRRVGKGHPAFAAIAEAAGPLLATRPEAAAKVAPGKAWDPFAFIDLCSAARRDPGLVELCGRLQRAEMLALLDASLAAAGA